MTHYTGSCHCGAVRFEFDADLDTPVVCNCSMCGRSGAMMAFIPRASITITGQEALQDYQFGKKHIHHPFCTTCGLKPLSWGEDREGNTLVSVNLRCVEGYDIQSAEVKWYDGASY
ncbi:MAG: GFA family protein [Myxococcota bacterium]